MQQAHVERIRAGGTHLLELINDVLDLTRADVRKLEVELRPVDAGAAIEEVVALLESQAAAKGIALRAEPCGAEIPRVQADLRRLRQVRTNLVGNAIKFTETGSVVLQKGEHRLSDVATLVLRAALGASAVGAGTT
ncbi:hypothetical protein BH23GEM5_BH23GEM5_25370 [soil metagenome]